MLFKGNSSRLEHLIEKIQANKENHDVTSEDLKREFCCYYYFQYLRQIFRIMFKLNINFIVFNMFYMKIK